MAPVMKTQDHSPNRLQELINAAVVGELSDDELRELEALLSADSEALATFVKCCQLEIDLRFQIRAALVGRRAIADVARGESELASQRPASSAVHGVEIPRSLVGLAAAVLIGLFAWWGASYWGEIPAERQPQPIARLAESDDAHWLGDEGPNVGHEFVEGDSVYLTKGRAGSACRAAPRSCSARLVS